MKLSALARQLGCECPPASENVEIKRIASPEDADGSSISFIADPRYLAAVAASGAAAVIVKKGAVIPGKICLAVDDPYCAFAKAGQLFEDRSPLFGEGIHPTADIDPSADIDSTVSIGPFSVIGKSCAVGGQTVIGAHCVIENGSKIGAGCRIDSGAIIRRQCVLRRWRYCPKQRRYWKRGIRQRQGGRQVDTHSVIRRGYY